MSVQSVDRPVAARATPAIDEPPRRFAPPLQPPRGDLRRPRPEASGGALPAEIAFLAGRGPPHALLRYVAALAGRQGVCADETLIAEGLMGEEDYYRALADRLGAPFAARGAALDRHWPGLVDEDFARLPKSARGPLWLAAPAGAAVARLIGAARAARGRPQFLITTRTALRAARRRQALPALAQAARYSAERVDPDLCARRAMTRPALVRTAFGAALCAAALFAPLAPISSAAGLGVAALFLCAVFVRLFAFAASFEKSEPRAAIEDPRLPAYTILIALYRESAVVPQLIDALNLLDYPRAKLDIKFILEADDAETAAALRRHPPYAPHEILVAPPGKPQTKPRALNLALPLARGALLCVFDAEDLPQSRQLRDAAALFARLPASVACLQASLVIDNGPQNLLTQLYALDYAALFDVFNKGLAAMGLPLFLGGTSNHFRVAALRAVGGWDAFNVTEDADLGLRLARAGYCVDTFASDTLEEAPARLSALFRQRIRWMKGWQQTALAHLRKPQRLFADLGPRRAVAALALFAANVAAPLLGPPLTVRLMWNAVRGDLLSPHSLGDVFFSTLWCFLALSGVAALLLPMLAGMARRRLFAFWPALMLLPVWLLFLSLAALFAAGELWPRPFYWDKTEHGVSPRGAK